MLYLYIYILNSCYYQRHVFPHCFTKSVVEKGMIVTYLTKDYKRHVERKADHLTKGMPTFFETGPRPGLFDRRHSTQLTWSWVYHLNKIIKSHKDVYIQLFEVMLSEWTCAVFTFSYPSKPTSSSHMTLQTARSWTWWNNGVTTPMHLQLRSVDKHEGRLGGEFFVETKTLKL